MKNGIEKRNSKTEFKSGEKKKQLEIAEKMLKKGIDIKEIMEVTELTKEEIEKIKSNSK